MGVLSGLRGAIKQAQMWGMTDSIASGAAPDSPMLSTRLDDSDPPWPQRPWVMAALCATAGLLFHACVDHDYGDPLDRWRMALATFVAVATLVFTLGMEIRRVHWAAGFALLWGAIMALIVWNGAGYNFDASPFEWPFWSGLLAVLVATPLFQTRRDVAPDGRFWKLWQMPYDRLHSHAWTDAVIGAASLAFVGLSFLLTVLIGEMFHLIGIDLIRELLRGEWFGWMLAGAAFGGAVGLLRERDKLVATLQRLVMIVLSVLAPVLAAALLIFLLSLVGTGLQPLWRSGFSTAALMMAAAAFAVLLANAAIGNGREERAGNLLLHVAAAALVAVVLPLAVIAFYSMHLRVLQYGWTPERLWGVIAAVIAVAYGISGLWSVVRGRHDFDDLLRPLQQKLAIGLVLLAGFLALPIVDFGAIATRDQLARLESGKVGADKFDWAALAFDFGPSGRQALARLAKSPDKARANRAKIAMSAKNRWDLGPGDDGDAAEVAYRATPLADKVRVLPAGRTLIPDFEKAIEEQQWCRDAPCILYWLSDQRVAVIGRGQARVMMLERDANGRWSPNYALGDSASRGDTALTVDDLVKAPVELRTVQRRQLFVGGKAVGGNFE